MARPTRIILALAVASALGAGCGNDARNIADSPAGNTAVPATTDSSGRVGPALDRVQVRLEPVATVESPTALSPRPGTTDLYVTEQVGRLRRIADGRLDATPAVDISTRVAAGGERGLLGVTFSPDGRTLFLYYTAKDGAMTVSSYPMPGTTADPAAEQVLLSIPHPRGNHNGGALVTGPDGYLYIGTGDGGGGGDPDGNGQRTDTLYGRILRVDPAAPTAGRPYGIPADNPFADGSRGRPEVWSYGLRNPWRIGFDQATGDLWIADVGQNEIEEINRVTVAQGRGRGANFGWNLMEGNEPYEGGKAPENHTPPVFEYGHAGGNCSVIGGYVYRGASIPALRGAYLFGDLCKARILALTVSDDGKRTEHRDIGVGVDAGSLASFGQGNDGEVYVLSLKAGLLRLTAADR